jgi:MFS family permease
LLPALLSLGPVADRVGRRPLLVAGIAVTVISSMVFAAAHSVAWLFAGEIIYGIGSALVMSCVSVAIRELHPGHHVASAALAASVAAAAGLTVGPLVSGLLAWLTPWPTVTPYLLDIVLATLLGKDRTPNRSPVVPARRTRHSHHPAGGRRFVRRARGLCQRRLAAHPATPPKPGRHT